MITCKICERETFCDSLPYHSKICKETHRLREELVNLRRKMGSYSEKASSLKHNLEIYAVRHKKLKKRKKFCKWNSIDGLSPSSTEQNPITSPNSNLNVYNETLLQKTFSMPSGDCNGHSSGAWSDRNSNADTACTQGDPGEQQEFQSKEQVCYEEIKEDVQKSIFALKRAKAIAEKIHGWGFDTYSMNDLDFNFSFELKVLLEDIKDPKISEFLHSLTNDCYRYLEIKGKYIKKKEKLSKIDLQQEKMPPDICKKKPLGPAVKSNFFKPRFPITSRPRKFKEDDLINIDGKIRERTSPTPKRSPGKRSPVGTRILQDIKSPNKLANRNHFQAIFTANNGVNTPPPLNFSKVFPNQDTPELRPQNSSASSVSSSGQKDYSEGSFGTPLSSLRFGPLNMLNLLQTNSNHLTPSLSSFGQQTKRMANDKLSCKERINFLISAFPKDFPTTATNTSGEKSLTFEKSLDLEKSGSIPSIELLMSSRGNGGITARIPTLLNTETSIFEDSAEKTKKEKKYEEVRRREIQQRRTRSRSMHNLRAIHLEEMEGKKIFPSLLEPHNNKGKTSEGNSKQSSSSKRFGSGMIGSARGMIESPVLKGYQSDTTTKKSGVRFMRE